jgi:hypothetical protein
MKRIIFCLLSAISGLLAAQNSEQYTYLDELALKSGTDKSSAFHNYTEIYARYFSSIKEKPLKFLEIGICEGNSVQLWEKYFPNAELHFIDISVDQAKYFSKRSHYHLADQESPQQLQEFIAKTGGGFDIIIDDGGHTMRQQIISFQQLFPHVNSGGMYIIEDLHTSYNQQYLKGNGRTTVEYLKTLVDEINFVGARTQCASHKNIDPSVVPYLNLMRGSIESIHFYTSLVIITKR